MTTPATISRTAPSRHQTAIRSLLSVADAIRGRIERHLAVEEVTFQQYNVLLILADGGTEGLPTLEVAERLLERTPGVTRLMDRLERRGLVARRRGEDRRQVLCSLTPSGAELASRLRPTVAQAEEAAVSGLNAHELGVLSHFLNRIRATTAISD
jgi:DNA-binding MarR family transcriptional regulator